MFVRMGKGRVELTIPCRKGLAPRAMTEIEWLDGRVTKVPELALGDAFGESVQAELDFGFDDVLEGLWVEVRHREQDKGALRAPGILRRNSACRVRFRW